MAEPADIDDRIEAKVDRLESERSELRTREVGNADESIPDRVREIEVELDRLWDWRRQRQALRDAGRDPDEAHERDRSVVEHYLQ